MQNTDIKPEEIADNYDNFQELENKIDPVKDYSKIKPGGGNGEKILLKTLGQEFAKPITAKDEQAKSMICPGCDLTFTKYSQLIQHKKAHGKYSYLCKICKDRWFKNKAKLNSHERTHKNITEISFHECEICLKKYSNICNLRRHIKLHNNDKRYECDVCKKKFIQSNALREHKLTHTDKRDYPCADCDKAFKTQRYLERHREYIHDDLSKANSFPCQICSRKFQSERNLLWHLKRHEENRFVTEESSKDKSKWHEPQSLSCRFCGKTFKQGSIVKIHERIHTGEKPYLCRNCGKTFSQSSQLLCHERFHTHERPYVCKICEKSFKFPRSLKDHINVHTGERPYICKVCNQGFKQRVHLHQHSLGHTGEKPHKCTHCGKGFRLKGNLHIHLRIHTGERPYLCKICGLRFIDLNGLKKHAKRHDLF